MRDKHPPLHPDEHGDWAAANAGVGLRLQTLEREVATLRAALDHAQAESNGRLVTWTIAVAETRELREALTVCQHTLRSAEQFIGNGIELGYITMPDRDCPDTAHGMLPAIRAALLYVPAQSHGEPPSVDAVDPHARHRER